MSHFKNLKLFSTEQVSDKESISKIVKVAEAMEAYSNGEKFTDILKDKIIASLFYEPSTRTKFSFHSAAHRLGAKIISEVEPRFSSLYKGETLADTLRVVEQYADIIIMRHPEQGSAKAATEILTKPFLNAGDGAGEHPTQALLDIYTILKEKKKCNGLNIMLCGDLKFGRTIHSLLKLLKSFEVNLFLVSPKPLRLPEKSYEIIRKNNIPYQESEDIEAFIAQTDVMYVTRIQKERFPDIQEYESLKDSYVIDNKLLKMAQDDITIMHPLPRVGEILPEVDSHPGAAYFRQAKNGVCVRMALMLLIAGREKQFI